MDEDEIMRAFKNAGSSFFLSKDDIGVAFEVWVSVDFDSGCLLLGSSWDVVVVSASRWSRFTLNFFTNCLVFFWLSTRIMTPSLFLEVMDVLATY